MVWQGVGGVVGWVAGYRWSGREQEGVKVEIYLMDISKEP